MSGGQQMTGVRLAGVIDYDDDTNESALNTVDQRRDEERSPRALGSQQLQKIEPSRRVGHSRGLERWRDDSISRAAISRRPIDN